MPPYKYASSSEDEIVDNSKTTVIENNQSLELPIKSKKLVIHKPNNTISENQNLDFKQTEVIEPPTKKLKNDSQANVKRLQSLKEMKKDYAAKKSLIKNALSYGGTPINKKIVFDNDVNGNVDNGKKKKYLFENEQMSDDSDFEPNFEVKEQFEGEKGRKLLELQSKYKNDKRFLLDERFIDDNDKIESEEQLDDLELEKQEQLKILEQVVGKKVTNQRQFNDRNATTNRKNMVKFDPTQPEHSNLIINNEGVKKQKKIRQKIDNTEPVKPEPQVSKEVFYKVPEKLKETFVNEKTQFSLLSTFSSNEPFEESVQDKSENQEKEIKKNSLINSRNPFKYDSSDEEDEVKDIPLKEDKPVADLKKQPPVRTLFWTEPFFFKADDFRLQEGMDFIEKIKTNVGTEFLAVRREVKGIVKAKVRNTVRKNKMFKKKLGGSKRRKHVRIKKALKK
ncbi:hypothetical protein ABEB36_006484 [Hypothenemus hampei]|uniref:Uncharacterized protein n=1 Tax=Hypothenemus hampei TaxID=57062 RepID=A0ABD1EUL9_HYPHA